MQVNKLAVLVLAGLSTFTLAGCLDHGSNASQLSAADALQKRRVGVGNNQPPTISGTPSTTATTGTSYSFKPSASDPNGDPLTFSITNRPLWAAFDAKTGLLSGVPTAAGTFANVAISVSDGRLSTSLAPFTISVTAPAPVATGSASLSWIPPTVKTDGTPLSNLAGYKVYYGTTATALTSVINLTNPGATSYTIAPLAAGTYYFTITAYDTMGAESAQPAPVSKTIT